MGPSLQTPLVMMGQVGRFKNAAHILRNTTKLTTRGSTSPDGVEMTLIRERKSTHRLGTRLIRFWESLLSSVDNNAMRTLRLGTSPSSLSYCSSESSQSYKSYPALGL